jgi:exonuclease SbcC
MRPLRLEIQGFTSFRERVCLDFQGLDLFAITGPTGAGKSSLIDAMVFALYGQVPRVGNQYAQLLSHGAERLSVRLDFAVGREHYRVARTLRSAGTPQTRLERIRDGEVEPLADRVKETAEQVERLLGLDYDGFVRAVVLPQGQFDAFLRGEPKERRKILVALLRLEAYERMQEAANRRAGECRREAEFIGAQLVHDFADATSEALARKHVESTAAQEAMDAASRQAAALDRAAEAAGAARRLAQELATADGLVAEETERAKAARARQAEAMAQLSRHEEERAAIETRLAASGVDDRRFLALSAAVPEAKRWEDLQGRRAQALSSLQARRAALDKGAVEMQAAEVTLSTAGAALTRAATALEAARGECQALAHRHAAHALRRDLSPGEACPVCTQPVVLLPPAASEESLDRVEGRVRSAQAAVESAQEKRTAASVAIERHRGQQATRAAEHARFEAEGETASRGIAEAEAALRSAGVLGDEALAPAAARALEAELRSLIAARTEAKGLEERRRELENGRALLLAEAAAAEARTVAAEERKAQAGVRRASLAEAEQSALAGLQALCRDLGLAGPTEASTGREVEAVEKHRALAQRELLRLTGEQSRLLAEAQAIEAGMARADELRARKEGLDKQFAVAQALAQHLRADQFLAYVQEEAMRVLAADGTRHLKQLSQGRYSLTCEGQEFFVVDHWNADHRRSVKTLSGGETFLASLGLALALAESFVTLAADGGAQDTLESLFLDEGFGTLDPETLGQVVRAIEELQGGSRLVGIVTHIPELAEQMPARVEVGRSDRGATLAVA